MLKSNLTNKVYIGSTCSTLSSRLNRHLNHYKRFLKKKSKYLTAIQILENNDYKIVLIEEYPCNSINELKAREQFYILSIDCVNKNIQNRSKQQYYIDNKEKYKNYYLDNKENILQKRMNYYTTNKNVICQKKRDYYIKNSNLIKEKRKQYYLKYKK
jgi:Uri superfamily endonuclease